MGLVACRSASPLTTTTLIALKKTYPSPAESATSQWLARLSQHAANGQPYRPPGLRSADSGPSPNCCHRYPVHATRITPGNAVPRHRRQKLCSPQRSQPIVLATQMVKAMTTYPSRIKTNRVIKATYPANRRVYSMIKVRINTPSAAASGRPCCSTNSGPHAPNQVRANQEDRPWVDSQ